MIRLSIIPCAVLAASNVFGGAAAEVASEINIAVSNEVAKTVATVAKEAAKTAAEAALKAIKDKKAELEEKRSEAKEQREIVKEDREYAEKTASEKKQAKLEEMSRIETRLFHIEHASAAEVADQFNTMWTGDFGVNWKITKMAIAFPESNTIMVTAPHGIVEACEKAVRELDVEPKQVYIEARFVELGNTASHKVGINWKGIAGGTTISATAGAGLQTTHLGKGVTKYTRTISSSKEERSYELSGASDNDAQVAYFNGTLSASQMSLTLSALDATEDVKTFSNPKIIVTSGKKATVDMTTKYPNVKIATKRTTGTSDSVDIASSLEAIPGTDSFMFAGEAFFSWGISLDVTPRICSNGIVTVSIVPTISSLDSWVETGTTSTDEEDSGTISTKYPVIKVQRLISEFDLASGTTAVIGGLSITEEKQVDNGIPLLREIPWIGPRIFGHMTRQKEQKEIVVFVTVGLVDPSNIQKDAGLPKNAVLGRQYTKGQKLEPGDRPEKNMEGLDSLDMRSLEDQAKDPLATETNSASSGFFMPFRRDPQYRRENRK